MNMTLIEMLNLVARLALVAMAIYLIYRIEMEAIRKNINGRALATVVGIILALVLAVLGVKIQNVLFGP